MMPQMLPPVAMVTAAPPNEPDSPSHGMPQPQPGMIWDMGRETGAKDIPQLMGVLRDSLYPSERECAADALAKVDWRTNPHVVQAIVTAARQDPAPTVRAACVHCLAGMNANTVAVLETVRALRMDTDARVRSEAEQAMISLTPNQPMSSKPAVLPVSSGR
jgi:hypothetical protein